MSHPLSRRSRFDRTQLAPWTLAGGEDPDIGDATRVRHRALLTDPELLGCFRRRFPDRADATYDQMVRLLGYVWDCPADGFTNVVGYRCGRCGCRRAEALGLSAAAQRGAHHRVELLDGQWLDRQR
jgi:hypothetical protein